MPALDFPATPTNGQVFTSNGSSWTYDSTKVAWRSSPYEPGAAITSATAPTTPQNGDIWFNTNDGTLYTYYNDGTTAQWVEVRSEIATSQVGLVPIVPSSIVVSSGTGSVSTNGLVTFTNAANISLNGVFSAAYRHYRLVVESNVITTSGIGIRYRTGTTDNSSNVYYQYWTLKRVSGVIQDNSGGPSTVYNLTAGTNGTTWTYWSGEIFSPFLSTMRTVATGQGFGNDATNSYMVNSSVLFDATTSFDGISLITSGVSGTVKVYGYN